MIWFMIFLENVSRGARFFTDVLAWTRDLEKVYTNYVLDLPFHSSFKLPLLGLMHFVNMDTYILTKDTKFKAFSKELYNFISELYSRFN